MGTTEGAIIVAILGLLGNLFGSWMANEKTTAVIQEQIRDMKEELGTLSVRVDKHNHLVERMALVESSTKSAHKRLDDAGIGRVRV